MKGAVASVEIFAFENETSSKRLTLTIAAPEPRPEGEGWQCWLVLADVHRPEIIRGTDSVDALARAIARSGDRAIGRAREWVTDLRVQGLVSYRDRAGEATFDFS